MTCLAEGEKEKQISGETSPRLHRLQRTYYGALDPILTVIPFMLSSSLCPSSLSSVVPLHQGYRQAYSGWLAACAHSYHVQCKVGAWKGGSATLNCGPQPKPNGGRFCRSPILVAPNCPVALERLPNMKGHSHSNPVCCAGAGEL